jgi:hypothetical protein
MILITVITASYKDFSMVRFWIRFKINFVPEIIFKKKEEVENVIKHIRKLKELINSKLICIPW